ncbi:MAG TPA: conjugative transposon protein TraM [Puia sp.]|jgi:conjugative transposon TraM protein|nr:conjugative transposon protein TraM [Puia sp.]
MKIKNRQLKFLRQRKFVTVIPIIVLPFIIILFILLGGGKTKSDPGIINQQSGFNTKLPDAHFKKGKEKDKLAIYEDMNKDSAKLAAQIKNDPYYKLEMHGEDTIKNNTMQLQNILQHSASKYNQPGFSNLQTSTSNIAVDSNEQKMSKKIEQLKKALNEKSSQNAGYSSIYNDANNSGEVSKLQNVMQMINAKNNDHDPEVSDLNNMLDKVMMIQHPEKMQDSMRKLSEKNKTKTFVVSIFPEENNITLLDSQINNSISQKIFYGLAEEGDGGEKQKQNAIEATIPESQTIVSGATIKLRLLNDIFINGIRISKNEFVYGTSSLSNERLKITISSLRSQNNLLPVSLEVYDMDGMAGISIPGSINRDVSKQSADEAISSIGLNTFDPSVGAQAAGAGIQAAKTLASKKIKLIRVTIRSGYKVLLKDNNQKTSS